MCKWISELLCSWNPNVLDHVYRYFVDLSGGVNFNSQSGQWQIQESGAGGAQYISQHRMNIKALLPIVASVALILALQAGVWFLWVDMAEKSIETPLRQLLLTRSLRANHVLNNTLQQTSRAQDVLGTRGTEREAQRRRHIEA